MSVELTYGFQAIASLAFMATLVAFDRHLRNDLDERTETALRPLAAAFGVLAILASTLWWVGRPSGDLARTHGETWLVLDGLSHVNNYLLMVASMRLLRPARHTRSPGWVRGAFLASSVLTVALHATGGAGDWCVAPGAVYSFATGVLLAVALERSLARNGVGALRYGTLAVGFWALMQLTFLPPMRDWEWVAGLRPMVGTFGLYVVGFGALVQVASTFLSVARAQREGLASLGAAEDDLGSTDEDEPMAADAVLERVRALLQERLDSAIMSGVPNTGVVVAQLDAAVVGSGSDWYRLYASDLEAVRRARADLGTGRLMMWSLPWSSTESSVASAHC